MYFLYASVRSFQDEEHWIVETLEQAFWDYIKPKIHDCLMYSACRLLFQLVLKIQMNFAYTSTCCLKGTLKIYLMQKSP